ncbi:Gldg family protein [Catenovulum sp. 2E275]|uniref:Gldg family protein n=1 Tax=Catenovulum sp. 2E275 TaxID=2980497 RepID=UPI0021CFE39A|nr:Gldg family protein [Catenovulum sp. 2E275]MCU4676810.1 Gldg family protein [Catenovulum sp. 2E275]
MKKVNTLIVLLSLAIIFFAATLLNNQYLTMYKLDLTDNKIYSLSEDSLNIINSINEPLHLYFFFSNDAAKELTQMHLYANQVKSFLFEYARLSKGSIQLNTIDPETDSLAHQQAESLGLKATSIDENGKKLYFGLGARNAYGQTAAIQFFDLTQKARLEYDICRLLQILIRPEKIKVSILSDLPINGKIERPLAQKQQNNWYFYQLLQQNYSVTLINSDIDKIPELTDVLLVINPHDLSVKLQFSIDQYLLKGGKLVIFADPLTESVDPAMKVSEALVALLKQWGVIISDQTIVQGTKNKLVIPFSNLQKAQQYTDLGLTTEHLSTSDITTASLNTINGSSFGYLLAREPVLFKLEPLLYSSELSHLMPLVDYQSTASPKIAQAPFIGSNQQYTLAAKISGLIVSAFSDMPEYRNKADFVSKNKDSNLIVVADTDLLADQFWLKTNYFLGQFIHSSFTNNYNFLTNIIDDLSTSDALSNLKSKTSLNRSFERVALFKAQVNEKFRAQIEILKAKLANTESKLLELNHQKHNSGLAIHNQTQQSVIEQFMLDRVQNRKALKEIQAQVNKEINQLGTIIKFINVIVAPILLTLSLYLLSLLFKRRKLD